MKTAHLDTVEVKCSSHFGPTTPSLKTRHFRREHSILIGTALGQRKGETASRKGQIGTRLFGCSMLVVAALAVVGCTVVDSTHSNNEEIIRETEYCASHGMGVDPLRGNLINQAVSAVTCDPGMKPGQVREPNK